MQEISRLILALRSKGWNDTDIDDLILYMGTGKEKYKLSGCYSISQNISSEAEKVCLKAQNE